jgi:Glycerol-3-phosphate cytidylyltransferase (EC 2.7.7.39)
LKKVVATGTFDLLHPGHLFYLTESRRLGDELYVIVARDKNVKHKPPPILPEGQRLQMIGALKPVDHAQLGDMHDMFCPIEEIRPAIITLGYNQHFDEKELEAALRSRGLSCRLVRIGRYEGDEYASSRAIVERILHIRTQSEGA